MGEAIRLYTKEIRTVEVVEPDHFDCDQGGRARPSRSLFLAALLVPKFCHGVRSWVTAVTRSPARLVP
jgi:hypothetical protein